MAMIQIKPEHITPFGGIFSIMEQFDALLYKVIDSTLRERCQPFGYFSRISSCRFKIESVLASIFMRLRL